MNQENPSHDDIIYTDDIELAAILMSMGKFVVIVGPEDISLLKLSEKELRELKQNREDSKRNLDQSNIPIDKNDQKFNL